jgi:hypothetical protein
MLFWEWTTPNYVGIGVNMTCNGQLYCLAAKESGGIFGFFLSNSLGKHVSEIRIRQFELFVYNPSPDELFVFVGTVQFPVDK